MSRRCAPTAADGRAPIPETLILRRSRALTTKAGDDSTYHGCRLPPSLWRLVRAMLAIDPRGESACHRRSRRSATGSVPSDALWAMLRFLKRDQRLKRILEQHDRAPRHGVPDLLLCRMRAVKAPDFRFIEVKRHDEALLDDQAAELEMLRRLELTVGIIRLEKPRTPAAPTPRRRWPSQECSATAGAGVELLTPGRSARTPNPCRSRKASSSSRGAPCDVRRNECDSRRRRRAR